MLDHGIPLPERPAVDVNTAFKPEIFTSEIDIHDKLFTYGKLKNWLPEPPRYQPLG